MSLTRIKAVLIQEYFITLNSLEIAVDIVFFPLMSIIVFGFLSLYLAGSADPIVGRNVLLGMIFWQAIFIVQYSVSVGSLWNIWSRNLSNMFITPLQIKEYITAHSLSGFTKAILVFILSAVLSDFVFQFNILDLGILNIVLILISFAIFAFSIGIAILGLIFRFGTKIQALAWGILTILQPLTASFYPVDVLPAPIRIISTFLPPTYIFEASRYGLKTGNIEWNLLFQSFVINLIYLLVAVVFFDLMFKQSKETGQFARNES